MNWINTCLLDVLITEMAIENAIVATDRTDASVERMSRAPSTPTVKRIESLE